MEVLRNQRSQFRLLQAAQDRMVFKGENGSYHVLGELPMNFAHLRISLVFIPNNEVYRYRYDLDLLNQLETDKITQLLCAKFYRLDRDGFTTDLDRLIELVEKNGRKFITPNSRMWFKRLTRLRKMNAPLLRNFCKQRCYSMNWIGAWWIAAL